MLEMTANSDDMVTRAYKRVHPNDQIVDAMIKG